MLTCAVWITIPGTPPTITRFEAAQRAAELDLPMPKAQRFQGHDINKQLTEAEPYRFVIRTAGEDGRQIEHQYELRVEAGVLKGPVTLYDITCTHVGGPKARGGTERVGQYRVRQLRDGPGGEHRYDMKITSRRGSPAETQRAVLAMGRRLDALFTTSNDMLSLNVVRVLCKHVTGSMAVPGPGAGMYFAYQDVLPVMDRLSDFLDSCGMHEAVHVVRLYDGEHERRVFATAADHHLRQELIDLHNRAEMMTLSGPHWRGKAREYTSLVNAMEEQITKHEQHLGFELSTAREALPLARGSLGRLQGRGTLPVRT